MSGPLVADNGLQRADDQFPSDEAALAARVDAHGPYLTVTSRFEASGLLRSRTVEREHTYDLTRLQDAVAYLEGDRDALERAAYWIPTDREFPMVVELPRSPPPLASLVEHGDLQHRAVVGDAVLERSCGCVVPPVVEA